jgi:hypothetical protein
MQNEIKAVKLTTAKDWIYIAGIQASLESNEFACTLTLPVCLDSSPCICTYPSIYNVRYRYLVSSQLLLLLPLTGYAEVWRWLVFARCSCRFDSAEYTATEIFLIRYRTRYRYNVTLGTQSMFIEGMV